MNAILDLIRQSPEIFALISMLDNLVYVAGSAFITISLFRLVLRKKPVVFIVCAVICFLMGTFDAYAAFRQSDFTSFLVSVFGLVLPYACMAILFEKKGLWKAMLVTAGYTFVEAIRFVILLIFFNFDNNSRNEPLELIVEFLVDVAVFLLTGLLLARWAKKHTDALNVTRTAAVLFLLTVASVAVFVTSLMLMGSAYSAERRSEFGFMLLNIPVLTATVTYALFSFFRMRVKTETYREQLNMQIRQYQWLEQMNEDLRMFRHDFPKKMRPLIAYLDNDRTDEAREMAEGFSDYVAHTGAKFHTGNYRLDTVLACEDQIAERDGITLDVPFDTVFPAEGIEADDIYTIFPNALDNAIEACRKTDGERVIRFRSHIVGDTVYVTVTNPMAGTLRRRGSELATDKEDKNAHGYGMRSMRRAAANYGKDNVSFSAENGEFELRIFLRFTGGDK